jgi:hypothetical protein
MFTPAIRAIYSVSNYLSSINEYNPCITAPGLLSTLPLLVTGIFANDPNNAIALEDFAVSANFLN